MVGGGGLVVGGGSVCGDCGGVSTGDGFQTSPQTPGSVFS